MDTISKIILTRIFNHSHSKAKNHESFQFKVKFSLVIIQRLKYNLAMDLDGFSDVIKILARWKKAMDYEKYLIWRGGLFFN